jgi:DNA primase
MLDLGEIVKKTRPRKNLSSAEMKRLVLVDNRFSRQVVEYLKKRGLTSEEISEVYWKSALPGRAIFPCKERREVVYWTGRGIGGQKPKYVFPRDGESPILRDEAVYRYDAFENLETVPELWITEGVFDALAVNGVAIFGKRAFDGQLRKILGLYPKKIVIALDKDARKEAELIWSKTKDLIPTEIVFPPDRWSDWGEALKDGYRRPS